jgi:hypothetical protein
MKNWSLIFTLLSILLTSLSLAEVGGVARVILIQGEVIATVQGKSAALKKDDWLSEGTQVKTSNRSFAKLIFIDKSTMNIGPKSEIMINQFPKDKAGIISLNKGQIRSKVTKDYMGMEKADNKSKLFIKTKTAAMGIRGTEFIAGYDEKTGYSTLDVLEGAVAMAKLDEFEMKDIKQFDQKVLEKAVSSPQAVLVKDGFKADVSKNLPKPSEPQKIPKEEVKKMESDEKMMKEKVSEGNASLPPGVNANQFKNDSKEMEKTMTKMLGEEKMAKVKEESNSMINRVPANFAQDAKPLAGPEGQLAPQPASAGNLPPLPIDKNLMTTMDPTLGVSSATNVVPPPNVQTNTTTNVKINASE